MKKTPVYVVLGSSGEHEDFRRWIVRAFTRKADADNEARELNELSGQIDARIWELHNAHRDDGDDSVESWDKLQKRIVRECAPLKRRDQNIDPATSWERVVYDVEQHELVEP